VKPDQETRPNPRLILGIVLAVLAFVFVVENTKSTKRPLAASRVDLPSWPGARFVATT